MKRREFDGEEVVKKKKKNKNEEARERKKEERVGKLPARACPLWDYFTASRTTNPNQRDNTAGERCLGTDRSSEVRPQCLSCPDTCIPSLLAREISVSLQPGKSPSLPRSRENTPRGSSSLIAAMDAASKSQPFVYGQ
ncbi:predicted protein [Coccidioides posadasii str. Silveira]|uniref:Predicted protein n=1 Tax=Coccidioides posadasii (strain RMSCC 757 / Silveira) TaxID=443226 RepID=E9D1S1_COCPS|nr:predicted protein [Coccidioides posadasii str. Silveira]